MFTVTIRDDGNMILTGRLDASQTDKASEALDQINTSKTLDFKELDYISSAGLGILLKHQKRLKAAGYSLKLTNLNKHIRDVFMFTGFDKIFEVE